MSMKDKFHDTIEYVVSMLKDAGYDPYGQLYAYASTGNETYITRKGNARSIVKECDRTELMQYISKTINR